MLPEPKVTVSATLSCLVSRDSCRGTLASVHSLPWDTRPAGTTCSPAPMPLPSPWDSEQVLPEWRPGYGAQVAKEVGSGFRGSLETQGTGEKHPAFGGSRMGTSLGGHFRPSTLQHTCGSSVEAGDTGFTVGRVTRGLAAALGERRGALAGTCRPRQTFQPQAVEGFPWPEQHGPSAHRQGQEVGPG